VQWCHRMATTRDHAEVPELKTVLGLESEAEDIPIKKGWSLSKKDKRKSSTGSSKSRSRGSEEGSPVDGEMKAIKEATTRD
jgi:hypothetical protein